MIIFLCIHLWFVTLINIILNSVFTLCALPDFLQEIYQDRKKFSEQVFKVASSDLVNMGIGVVSYTLKDVHDDQVTFTHATRPLSHTHIF